MILSFIIYIYNVIIGSAFLFCNQPFQQQWARRFKFGKIFKRKINGIQWVLFVEIFEGIIVPVKIFGLKYIHVSIRF